MSMKKILPVLLITILFSVCLLNSTVFATNIVTIDASNTAVTTGNTTGASSITITSQSGNNTAKNNVVTTPVNNLVSANNTANNTQNNISSYNNVANKANTSAGLPYTGSSSSMVLIVVALVGSAIYAYKKIRDYNI